MTWLDKIPGWSKPYDDALVWVKIGGRGVVETRAYVQAYPEKVMGPVDMYRDNPEHLARLLDKGIAALLVVSLQELDYILPYQAHMYFAHEENFEKAAKYIDIVQSKCPSLDIRNFDKRSLEFLNK